MGLLDSIKDAATGKTNMTFLGDVINLQFAYLEASDLEIYKDLKNYQRKKHPGKDIPIPEQLRDYYEGEGRHILKDGMIGQLLEIQRSYKEALNSAKPSDVLPPLMLIRLERWVQEYGTGRKSVRDIEKNYPQFAATDLAKKLLRDRKKQEEKDLKEKEKKEKKDDKNTEKVRKHADKAWEKEAGKARKEAEKAKEKGKKPQYTDHHRSSRN